MESGDDERGGVKLTGKKQGKRKELGDLVEGGGERMGKLIVKGTLRAGRH